MTDLLIRPIPSTGEHVPVIGLGTWQTFDVGPGDAERRPLREVLRAFVERGGRLVDSSPMYGRAEQVVGDLSASLGIEAQLFVATKVWTTGQAAGVRQMEDSMRKLRSSPLDLMQVHNLLDVDTHLRTRHRGPLLADSRRLGTFAPHGSKGERAAPRNATGCFGGSEALTRVDRRLMRR